MESESLTTFKRKMANPLNWRKANQILGRYTKEDLSNLTGSKRLIQEISETLGVPLSTAEVTQAAKWLIAKEFDPQSTRERLLLWKNIK